MSWSLFHFKCRFLANRLVQGDSKQSALSALEAFDTKPLFGKQTLNYAANKLFNDILSITQPDKLLTCLQSYSSIDSHNFQLNNDIVDKQKRALNYICSLYVIYFIIAQLFKHKVFPTFKDTYDLFDSELPGQFLAFDNVFLLSNILLIGLILLQFLIYRQFANFDRYLVFAPTKRQFFIPKLIDSNLTNLRQLFLAPINLAKGQNLSDQTKAIYELESQGMTVSAEYSTFITVTQAELERNVKKTFDRCHAIIQVLLYTMIGFLITVMYLPIFSLGAII
ncbi:hypothetical protein [Thalassotalea crassostreae]|uniref:hypothetical protein n=1 Tax=Thalassotalea crassostreae TaxID=1763536 RepID=UPI0008A341EB|nr:hypothetical protein [Thalassotalea crassostreae]